MLYGYSVNELRLLFFEGFTLLRACFFDFKRGGRQSVEGIQICVFGIIGPSIAHHGGIFDLRMPYPHLMTINLSFCPNKILLGISNRERGGWTAFSKLSFLRTAKANKHLFLFKIPMLWSRTFRLQCGVTIGDFFCQQGQPFSHIGFV